MNLRRASWLAALATLLPAPVAAVPADAELAAYRAELYALRREFGGVRALPDVRFFLFGMGQRPKFLYRDGRLREARSGKVVRAWDLGSDLIVPPEYCVLLQTAAGARVTILHAAHVARRRSLPVSGIGLPW